MSHLAYRLAAYATAAIPGFEATGVSIVPGKAHCDAADIRDAHGDLWRIQAPRQAEATQRMARETAMWDALAGVELPFVVPQTEGRVTRPDGTECVVYRRPPGRPATLEDFSTDSACTANVARAIASLHSVPRSELGSAEIPAFTAAEYRLRRLAELSAAIDTTYVPAELAARWHAALAPSSRWDFEPTLVHGDLVAEHIIIDACHVRCITDWAEAKIADPADDVAWLLAAPGPDVAETALAAYRAARTGVDDHLAWRARLAGELSVVRWLLYGMSITSRDIVAAARKMLRELAKDAVAGRLPN